jgi:hypothetical protein
MEKVVRQKWRQLKATMDERARRLWAGTEAGAIGYGGVAAVARATGMAISTVRKGRDEARAGARRKDVVSVRRSSGKRPFELLHPEVWPALELLVDPVTRGDPESALRWTCKSSKQSIDGAQCRRPAKKLSRARRRGPGNGERLSSTGPADDLPSCRGRVRGGASQLGSAALVRTASI